jgi:hypothetical protein
MYNASAGVSKPAPHKIPSQLIKLFVNAVASTG